MARSGRWGTMQRRRERVRRKHGARPPITQTGSCARGPASAQHIAGPAPSPVSCGIVSGYHSGDRPFFPIPVHLWGHLSVRRPEGGQTCDNGGNTPASPGRSPWPTRAWTLFTQRGSRDARRTGSHSHRAAHVRRGARLLPAQAPPARVTLLCPSEDVEAEARRARPHLIVANRVPRTARAGCFWVEVAEPIGGWGAKRLGAEISADGYSGSVANVSTGDVLEALDRAEEQLVL